MTLFFDTGAPGYWADAIANSPTLNVVDAAPLHRAPSHEAECLEARAAVSPSLHSSTPTAGSQRNHG